MNNHPWTKNDISGQEGKVAIITGGNSGLGYASALALAEKGVTVVIACRNTQKGNIAYNNIKLNFPKSNVEMIKLDLAKRSSIEEFAKTFQRKYKKLHILMNNAGVMATPQQKTKDGYEYQFGINHLGHFILTGLLLPILQNTPESRIINLASLAAQNGKIYFEDIMHNKKYSPFRMYAQTKLAVLLFSLELNKRLFAAGSHVKSIAVHPGGSQTNLGEGAKLNPIFRMMFSGFLSKFVMQPAKQGALPQLYAATSPDAESGKYYGPDGWREIKGYPKLLKLPASAQDEEVWKKLWEVSEDLTGMKFL
ncbi:MAG: oxidoreductase [Saprospiraceae bacterium]